MEKYSGERQGKIGSRPVEEVKEESGRRKKRNG